MEKIKYIQPILLDDDDLGDDDPIIIDQPNSQGDHGDIEIDFGGGGE